MSASPVPPTTVEKARRSEASQFISRLPVRKQNAAQKQQPTDQGSVKIASIESPLVSVPEAEVANPESASKLSQIRSRIPRRRPRKNEASGSSIESMTPKVQSVVAAHRPGLKMLFKAYQRPAKNGTSAFIDSTNFVKLCRDFGVCDGLLSRKEVTALFKLSCDRPGPGTEARMNGNANESRFIWCLVQCATSAYSQLPMVDLSEKVSSIQAGQN